MLKYINFRLYNFTFIGTHFLEKKIDEYFYLSYANIYNKMKTTNVKVTYILNIHARSDSDRKEKLDFFALLFDLATILS